MEKTIEEKLLEFRRKENINMEEMYLFFSQNYKFFSPYETYFYLRYNEFKLVSSLFPNIFDGKDILEIGCGFGFNSFMLSYKAKGVLGIDIPEKYSSLVVGEEATSVQVANELNNVLRMGNVRFEESWPTDIKCCEKESYDMVFSEYVFEHIPET